MLDAFAKKLKAVILLEASHRMLCTRGEGQRYLAYHFSPFSFLQLQKCRYINIRTPVYNGPPAAIHRLFVHFLHFFSILLKDLGLFFNIALIYFNM